MEYHTGQRKALQDFFASHPHDMFTVKEIAEALKGSSISLSAIYRNLALMTEDGAIRRSMREGGRESVYQYMEGAVCHNCLHMTCVSCGKVFHMDGAIARHIQEDLARTDGFRIDRSRTVLYGTCRRCGNE